jgi:hypothetical protein
MNHACASSRPESIFTFPLSIFKRPCGMFASFRFPQYNPQALLRVRSEHSTPEGSRSINETQQIPLVNSLVTAFF